MYTVNSFRQLNAISKAMDSGQLSECEIVFKMCTDDAMRAALKAYICTTLVAGDFKKGKQQFLTNRYFLDSIGVKLFPTQKEIVSLTNTISDKLKISNSDMLSVSFDAHIKKICGQLPKKINLEINTSLNDQYLITSLEDAQLQTFDEQGYLIIENAISASLCDEILTQLKALAQSEAKNKSAFFYGSGKSQRIYHLINKRSVFQDLILNPVVAALNEHAFSRPTLHDKYFLSSFHANILAGGAEAQVIHVDAAVPNPLPEWIIRTNVNFILQDYTKENGATLCIPGSHRICKTPDRSQDYSQQLIPLEAKKGALVFWNGHLWHQSGHNQTNDERYALLGCFAASFLREMVMEENFYCAPGALDSSTFNTELKTLLGFDHGVKQ